MVKPPTKRSAAFFKVMIGDFKSCLRIPPPFAKHLRRAKLGADSVLRSATGRKWRVKLGRMGRQWSFQSGWEAFAKDHSLALGDFIVFSHDGRLGFDVRIFDKSGCERGGEGEEVGKAREAPFEKLSWAEKEERKQLVLGQMTSQAISVTRPSSMVEKWSALEAPHSFKPRNPHFFSIHGRSQRDHLMIPRVLVNEFALLGKKFLVLRDPSGRPWRVRVSPRRDGRAELRAGWCDFCKGNCLREGDTSVFEFVPGGNEILVHIFRVKEEITESTIKPVALDVGLSVKPAKISPTEDVRERALNAAASFKTKHPYFVYVCKLRCSYKMTLPRKVAREVNLQKKLLILYDPCGGSWPVEVHKQTNGNTDLSVGFLDFIRGNHLEEGDACVFEFLEADAVRVHIFRVKDTKAV